MGQFGRCSFRKMATRLQQRQKMAPFAYGMRQHEAQLLCHSMHNLKFRF
jgi:hypothetical protein